MAGIIAESEDKGWQTLIHHKSVQTGERCESEGLRFYTLYIYKTFSDLMVLSYLV